MVSDEEILIAKREYMRCYRKSNKEHIREKNKAWRERNKEKIKQYQKSYWEKKAVEISIN